MSQAPLIEVDVASTFTVRSLAPHDEAAWDDFIRRRPEAGPFHLIAWKRVIEEVYGFKPHYLLAESGGQIRGVLPLFEIRNPIVGHVLISSPFATLGGIVAESPEALRAIADSLKELALRLQVDYVELRNAWPSQCAGFERIRRYVTFTLASDADDETLLRRLPANMRSNVRRALKRPFAARQTRRLEDFIAIHAGNYRRLGTPSFSRRHYDAILRHFGDAVEICEILLEDKVVAGSMNFSFRDQSHSFYVASDERYHEHLPNNFLYFQNLRDAREGGRTVLDLGRSKRETGPFEFKRRWGAEMRELPYEILLVRRKELPNFSPANPKFQRAINAWKRLPLPVTRALGPFFIRLFP